jgi:hypothetical protein
VTATADAPSTPEVTATADAPSTSE